MKYLIKSIVSVLSIVLFLTTISIAKKQFVPIINDNLLTFASYYTTTNNLKVPILQNSDSELLVQCEDDISYFLAAYNSWDEKKPSINTNIGNVIIDQHGTVDEVSYIKGHIEGTESITISSTYYPFGNTSKIIKTCRSKITSVNKLKVPTFNGNSQGKLVIQCENDVVYYIMAYDCLRWDTNPSVSTDNGIAITDEKRHVGEVFYIKGHVERTGGPVTIMGHVYSGGKDLYRWPDWTKKCP